MGVLYNDNASPRITKNVGMMEGLLQSIIECTNGWKTEILDNMQMKSEQLESTRRWIRRIFGSLSSFLKIIIHTAYVNKYITFYQVESLTAVCVAILDPAKGDLAEDEHDTIMTRLITEIRNYLAEIKGKEILFVTPYVQRRASDPVIARPA